MRGTRGELWRVISILLCAAIGTAGCAMPSAGGPKGVAAKTVSTLAGEPGVMGSTDAAGTGATFAYPAGVVFVPSDNCLYIADSINSTIRQLNLTTGVVKTIAGVAGVAGYFDNASYPTLAAYFYNPEGIATDGTNLYVADSGNNAIRKIVISSGIVTTIAGSPSVQPPGSTDGTGTSALFNNPLGICYDGANTLYVADSGNSTIRKITISTGAVATIAGQAAAQGSGDGTGSAATFTWPQGIAFDSTNGCLYVVDTGNGTIRQIATPGVATSVLTTIAGQAGVKGDADGIGRGASFNWPEGIVIDSTNTNLYVADTLNSTIRQVAIASGTVVTLAGRGGVTGSADGAADSATFNNPMRLVCDSSNNLYVADTYNETIRLIK
jgi:sugar lactone lactonase YvrE